jgi:uncharacterized protein
MLDLRPTCEHCNKPLPPSATDARICSYECTFCAECAERLLSNVCPNCGGGFFQRPIRPRTAWVKERGTGFHPPSTDGVQKTVDLEAHRALVLEVAALPPECR